MDQSILNRLPMLVKMRNLISTFSGGERVATAMQSLAHELDSLTGLPEDQALYIDMDTRQRTARDILASITVDLNNNKDKLQAEIDTLVPTLLTAQWFEDCLQMNPDLDFDRTKWTLEPEHLLAVGMICSDTNVWKYPTGLINTQHQELVDFLLPSQFVYLIDQDLNRIKDLSKNLVNPHFRTHYVSTFDNLEFEQNVTPGFPDVNWGLPEGQLGILICWNLFERYTLEKMKQNLNTIIKLMRPGGSILFNIVNGDSNAGIDYTCERTCSYITKPLLTQMLEELNLTLKLWEPTLNTSKIMVQVTVPGELTSSITQRSRGIIRRS